jgi:TIR domain
MASGRGRAQTMALPIVRPVLSAPATQQRSLVFVSYSHRDWLEFGAAFERFFKLAVSGRPNLPFDSQSIYVERNDIKAGDEWDDRIQGALDRAAALVFLVSGHSLSSKYCVKRELRYAVDNRIPIIPVILSPCPWEGQTVESRPNEPVFAQLSGVPKNDSYDLVPISMWANRDEAWNTTVRQLVDGLDNRRDERAAPLFGSARMPKVLPYLCNQQHVEAHVARGLRQWTRRAIIVFVKGNLDDRTSLFWGRLLANEVNRYVTKKLSTTILEQRPLSWPSLDPDDLAPERLRENMLMALSKALTSDEFQVDSADALAASLTELPGILPLMCTLPDAPSEAIAASIRALTALLDECPEGAPIDRLAFGILVESTPLLGEEHLVEKLALGTPRRTLFVDPERIGELDANDVREWYRSNPISRYTPLDEYELAKRVFEGAEHLRFAGFEVQLKKINLL